MQQSALPLHSTEQADTMRTRHPERHGQTWPDPMTLTKEVFPDAFKYDSHGKLRACFDDDAPVTPRQKFRPS